MTTEHAGRHGGSVVIITGGASGIGRACAVRLLGEGASVVIADVNGPAAKDTAGALSDDGRAVGVEVDIRSRPGCETMVQAALDAFGTVTGLINAAGVNSPKQDIVDLPLEEWQRVLDVNLTGTLAAIQAVAPHLGDGGAIVTLASGAGRTARTGAAAYCVSKAGVLMLTKVAALELGPQGVRVNAIAPGFIDTEMNREKLTPERRAAIQRRTPLQRVGLPEEIAAVASFLLSSDASYVCGELIEVDGGVAAPTRA